MALPVPFHGLIDKKFEYARNLNFGPKGAHVPNFERAPDLKTGPRFRKSSKFGAKVQNLSVLEIWSLVSKSKIAPNLEPNCQNKMFSTFQF